MRFQATVAALIVFSAITSSAQSELSENRKAELSRKMDARFAAGYLEKSNSAQDLIVAMELSLRESAILAAAGQLNLKLYDWGETMIDGGELTGRQLSYIASVAMLSLAQLAQAAGMNEKVKCHFTESRLLAAIANGEERQPVVCRQDAYGRGFQERALKQAYRPEMKRIAELVNTWATNVVLLAQVSGRLDNYGKSVRPRTK
jgi:hypothetical protein